MNYKDNIPSFTAADIERYHRGLLNAAEMHRMEKAALEDPFLADALEGYEISGTQAQADLTDLQKRLEARIQESADEKVIPISRAGSRNFPWMRAAAAVILIAGAGWLTYRFGFDTNNDKGNVVQNIPAKTDNTVTPTPDSVSNGFNAITPTDSKKYTITADKPAAKTPADNPGAEQPLSQATKDDQASAVNQPTATQKELAENDSRAKQEQAANVSAKTSVNAEEVSNAQAVKARAVAAAPQKKQADERKLYEVDAANANNQTRNQQAFIPRNVYRGRVLDANNNPLPFANVTNVQDGIGTYADAKGNFVLTSPDSTMNVKVRSVGFETNQLSLQRNGIANRVVLAEDHSQVQTMVLNNRQLNTNRSRSSTIVFEEPEPLDGWENYDAYLANNIQEPEASTQLKRAASGGEVSVSFEVNEYGEPVNFKIEKSLCTICDKEAIRLIKEGPRWKRKAGKRVTVSVPFG
ncbi:carboxypeptidase-like regulatory domain-containing protein [Terrimonas ferruginea]|uniref:carboxypeptidase-like regulatory domain-containing protein n=1 Tax=Terrimonas ferruginea TaxID=249 RepID=UPI0004105CB9|nr:carboxypeptidase-like regulatory domain-containing protein [Terrimonas ferruginea]